ncbi:MAG: glutathione S-transferase family protein [Hyphomicrobiaceae bacterium]
MSIELYHAGVSVCSEKVRLVLAERGLDFASHLLDLRAGDQQQPDYVKLNSNAVVPTLVHDGNVLVESNVISEYLAEAFPGPTLTTSDPVSRARMRVWTKQLDESIHQLTSVISFAIGFRHQLLAKPRDEALAVLSKIPDQARRERQIDVYEKGVESAHFVPAVRRFEKMLGDMQAALDRTPWLAGNEMSLADIAFTPYVNRLDQLQMAFMWDGRPKVAQWFETMRARPSYAKAYSGWMAKPVLDTMREKGNEAQPRLKQIVSSIR